MNRRYLSLENLISHPQTLLTLADHFADIEGTCLLYSGTTYETAENSYLFLFPYDHLKIEGKIQCRYGWNRPTVFSREANPWDALEELGSDIGRGTSSFPEWVGFLGYEMGAFSDRDVALPYLKAETPEAYWQRCALTLKYEHATRSSVVQVIGSEENFLNDLHKAWYKKLSTREGWEHLIALPAQRQKKKPSLKVDALSDTKKTYHDKIGRVKELIKSGDIYQMNLSQQWEFFGSIDALDVFKRLARLNPAPFAAYLYFKDLSVICSSPERFLKNQQGVLETRPIKGTAPRGKSAIEDDENKQRLLRSEKERAELMMITDLMRNDLGKMSVNGSVTVPLVCGCEAYHNVFHLYSVVKSRVLNDLSPFEIIRGCFPGGSITGCPKLRSMEVIAELEQRPRGIYTGAIGYISGNGDFDLNIAIRTLIVSHQKGKLQIGGGIVIDSIADCEYEEIYHKGRSIFECMSIESP